MIICRVGKCPIDGKTPICCLYCLKQKDCPSACNRTNMSCSLSREVANEKEEYKKGES